MYKILRRYPRRYGFSCVNVESSLSFANCLSYTISMLLVSTFSSALVYTLMVFSVLPNYLVVMQPRKVLYILLANQFQLYHEIMFNELRQ